MDSTTLILSLVFIAIAVYVIFFQKNKETRERKNYYLKRFIRNREQALKHINEVEALVKLNDAWDKKAFPNREILFSEYVEELKAKYENDYSKASYQILKKNNLSYSQKQEYTKALIIQSEDLYLMEVDLGMIKKSLEKVAS